MRPSRKPKYKFSPNRLDIDKIDKKEKKDKDISIEDSYREYLISKIKKRHR